MNEAPGSTVLYEVADGIATITMNRPHAKNALSVALQRDLYAAFSGATQDNAVRVILLTGAGMHSVPASTLRNSERSATTLKRETHLTAGSLSTPARSQSSVR
jgi:1,4-dihydroxy-2-naphthoyl-CoA synthase